MSLKEYGIYIAYPPTVDLRSEGLGRHLAMFLKGAGNLKGIRFTIVCPSWTKDSLQQLFESEQVGTDSFRIFAPGKKPYALRCFELSAALRKYFSGKKSKYKTVDVRRYIGLTSWNRLAKRAVAIYSLVSLIGFIPYLLLFILEIFVYLCGAIPIFILGAWFYGFRAIARKMKHRLPRQLRDVRGRLSSLLNDPKQKGWVLQLYEELQKQEASRMQKIIYSIPDVLAWYCPTAFWPDFHDIEAPRLMCVPDVVLSEFPVGFSDIGGGRFVWSFDSVETAIARGDRFVTYSDSVKWNTLVDRYMVSADKVSVIPHAPNNLSQYVSLAGTLNNEESSINYSKSILIRAVRRSRNGYLRSFENGDVKFLFYASQFRPNKNIITLLRAYEYLLRRRFIGHKLVMTGNPEVIKSIRDFVDDHYLNNDVIFLQKISVSELAACYKLADLAVNPSLSEGGCPFTFTEALSVDTPVVMARIPVTEELLDEPNLKRVTFFDPYDWRDCARQIEWALHHRDEVLSLQREAYSMLSKRTWTDVVAEHVELLDRMASHCG